MADYSDIEQLDAMRGWWAENGNFVLGGIAAGLLILFGWNRWQTGVANAEIAASTLYEEVMSAAGSGQLEQAIEPATELFDEYGASSYAALARLAMARMYMDNSRDQDAAESLRPLVESTSAGEVAMVARLRLAKILLYQGNAEQATDLLKGHQDNAFSAQYNELLGDAYVKMGSFAEAEAAYVAAMNDNPASPTVDINLIQLKINDLPVPDEIAAAVDAAGLSPDEEPAAEDEEDEEEMLPMPPEDDAPDAAESGSEDE